MLKSHICSCPTTEIPILTSCIADQLFVAKCTIISKSLFLHYVYTEDGEVFAINNINGSLFDWLYLQDIANHIYGTLVTQFSIFNFIARFRKIPVYNYYYITSMYCSMKSK